MKRGRNQSKPLPTNLVLEEVVGLTTKNGNGLASNALSSKFAYIAGCVVVLHDVHSGTRSHFMVPNRDPKPLSCVTLSLDGSIVIAGESGSQPGVLVWNGNSSGFICELRGHQYGVACMALSADGKHLVSVGFPRDGCMCFWDWQNKTLATKIKISSVSCPTTSVEFSLDNKFVVTADKNHLKFWKVRWSKGSRTSTRSTSVILHRKVDLDHCKDLTFVAVTSMRCMGSSSINHIQAGEQEAPFYAVTEKGMLCMVYPGSSVINSVELEVMKCFALSISASLVACACNEGLVKLFGTNSLKYAGGLLYAEANGCRKSTLLDYKTDMKQFELQTGPTCPDAIACQFSTPEKLVVIYDDHSLYIWDVHKIDQATRCCVLVSHGGCIWDIKNVPCENMHDPSFSCVAKGCSGGLSFATCALDGNIRLWDFALQSELSENIFSHPRDDNSHGDKCLVNAGIFERDSVARGLSSPPGFRSMAVSSDGKCLATGDCQGNIHIFDLYTSDYKCIKDAHGSEIRSLSFNMAAKNDPSTEYLESHLYLASGGQDGRIHLYDVERNYNLFGTIDHHSAVTSVKVSSNGCQILSCTDRFLILHGVDVSSKEHKFSCLRRIATNGTIYDMDVDLQMDVAFTVGEVWMKEKNLSIFTWPNKMDQKISVYDIQSGKRIKWFNHDRTRDSGNLLKLTTDGSRSYLACSYSDRYISIYDCISGKIVAQATGHGKVVTGIIFLPDCKHLVSVGAEGCIFVWRLPTHISSRMLHRNKEIFSNFLPQSINQLMTCSHAKSDLIDDQNWEDHSEGTSLNRNLDPIHQRMLCQEANSLGNAGFKFSISELPKWAQCKISNNSLPPEIDSSSSKICSHINNGCLESDSVSKDVLECGQHFSTTSSRHQPGTEGSQISPSSSHTFSRTENCWLTIHTVCMDLLDSPDTCDMKGLNVQRSATESISQSQEMETIHPNKCIKLTCPDPCIRNPPEESYSEQHDPLWINNPSFSQGTNKDADASRKDSQENENYITNSHGSSVQLKRYERGTMIGSLSQFVVQGDLPGVRKRSLSMHAAEDSVNGTVKMAKRNQPSKSLLQEKPSTEDAENAPLSLLWQCDNDKVEKVEITRSCEEALHNLEAAAENAMQSFCRLATVNIEEDKPRVAEAAATRLPSIEKKIRAIGKLLQPAKNLRRENNMLEEQGMANQTLT